MNLMGTTESGPSLWKSTTKRQWHPGSTGRLATCCSTCCTVESNGTAALSFLCASLTRGPAPPPSSSVGRACVPSPNAYVWWPHTDPSSWTCQTKQDMGLQKAPVCYCAEECDVGLKLQDAQFLIQDAVSTICLFTSSRSRCSFL